METGIVVAIIGLIGTIIAAIIKKKTTISHEVTLQSYMALHKKSGGSYDIDEQLVRILSLKEKVLNGLPVKCHNCRHYGVAERSRDDGPFGFIQLPMLAMCCWPAAIVFVLTRENVYKCCECDWVMFRSTKKPRS